MALTLMRLAPCLLLLAAVSATAASAQDRVRPLSFERGEYATTVRGLVAGYDVHDYVLRAQRGQRMRVELRTESVAEILVLNDETFERIGSSEGGTYWEGRLPYSGAYRIRILQNRASARRGERSAYSLFVEII